MVRGGCPFATGHAWLAPGPGQARAAAYLRTRQSSDQGSPTTDQRHTHQASPLTVGAPNSIHRHPLRRSLLRPPRSARWPVDSEEASWRRLRRRFPSPPRSRSREPPIMWSWSGGARRARRIPLRRVRARAADRPVRRAAPGRLHHRSARRTRRLRVRVRPAADGDGGEPVPQAVVPGGRWGADRMDRGGVPVEYMQEVDQVSQYLADVRGNVSTECPTTA